MSSTPEGNNDQVRRELSVSISTDDPNIRGQNTNNNGATNISDQHKKEKKSKNPYKKFNAETRDKVILRCQTVLFLLAAGICAASFTVPALRKSRPRGIAMWQWSLLASVLLVGPLLSRAIFQLVLFINDREFSAKENILYYVAGLIESAWVFVWFSMILVAWLIVVDEPDYLGVPSDKSEKIIKKFNTTWPIINITLVTLILGSFFWLAKNLVLMRTKSSFHIRRFFDRVRETLKHQSVVEALSTLPPSKNVVDIPIDDTIVKDKRKWVQKFQEMIDYFRKKEVDLKATCLDEVTRDDVSCWGMKKVIDWIMKNPHLIFDDKPIKSDEEAAEVVDHIYKSFVKNDQLPPSSITWEELSKELSSSLTKKRKFLLEEELSRPLTDDKLNKDWPDYETKILLDKVQKCLLEGVDPNQDIQIDAFKKWMVKAYKHRLAVASALTDNKKLFRTFNRLINVLLLLFISALWLIMIRVETRRVIFVIATAIVGGAVIFGDSCKKILDNLVFIFVVHPYDIGDYCNIDNTTVKIDKIHVFTTLAYTLFDDELRHYPNSDLASKTISNYTRSLDMGDVIEFRLERETPTHMVKYLKEEVNRYISENKIIWKQEHKWVTEFQDDTMMNMKLHFRYKINYDDFSEREDKKSELVMKIKEILNAAKDLIETNNT